MKPFLFVLFCLFLFSCKQSNTLEVVSTGEKVVLDAHPYVLGDTVIIYQTSYSSSWRMDKNWVFLSDTAILSVNGIDLIYREAVVIE